MPVLEPKMADKRTRWLDACPQILFPGGPGRRDEPLTRPGNTIHVRRNAPTSGPANIVVKAPKSGPVRSVPLVDQAAATFEAVSRRDRFIGPEDLVFPSPMGVMLDGPKVRGAFYRALAKAGLGHLRDKEEPMTFHDLRHTFGTLAVRAFSVTDVMVMMGHADIKTTMRYVHYVPQHDAAIKLSAVFAVEVGETDALAATG
ncbi:phage integrase family protein [Baekduia soli]|uniref:Phage integrase family protein n=1 Tax=Baekduia soli TaxID=496014 RepID=A0A5B8U908_9ACTN|nr:tyrosine-type recombinase/integrase [Baekduia soli]QEC49564.1 phage integrase family protein [Baekduia soli]